ncbi:MAG: hypothetical protein ACP5D7_01775 [Limnospira sp.]
MDVLTQQVIALTHKVDALYEIVMQLSEKSNVDDKQMSLPSLSLTVETPEPQSVAEETVGGTSGDDTRFPASPPPPTLLRLESRRAEHKDILIDDCYTDSTNIIHRQEPTLTAEVQIQRLTAQLTAAYNRIAALEEQLLSKRVRL